MNKQAGHDQEANGFCLKARQSIAEYQSTSPETVRAVLANTNWQINLNSSEGENHAE